MMLKRRTFLALGASTTVVACTSTTSTSKFKPFIETVKVTGFNVEIGHFKRPANDHIGDQGIDWFVSKLERSLNSELVGLGNGVSPMHVTVFLHYAFIPRSKITKGRVTTSVRGHNKVALLDLRVDSDTISWDLSKDPVSSSDAVIRDYISSLKWNLERARVLTKG